MAGEIGNEITYLEDDLLDNSTSYDYFQAVRMIGLIGKQQDDSGYDVNNYKLNVTPKLSFDYPSSDISAIDHQGAQLPFRGGWFLYWSCELAAQI